MPLELVALLSRSRPVVRQVPHWPCKGAGQAVVQHRGGIEGLSWRGIGIEQGHCPVACHCLGFEAQGSLAEIDIVVVKEQESPLEDIAINGTLPGQSKAIGVNELKNVPKPFQVHFGDLKKALGMATSLLKKVDKQESSG